MGIQRAAQGSFWKKPGPVHGRLLRLGKPEYIFLSQTDLQQLAVLGESDILGQRHLVRLVRDGRIEIPVHEALEALPVAGGCGQRRAADLQ